MPPSEKPLLPSQCDVKTWPDGASQQLQDCGQVGLQEKDRGPTGQQQQQAGVAGNPAHHQLQDQPRDCQRGCLAGGGAEPLLCPFWGSTHPCSDKVLCPCCIVPPGAAGELHKAALHRLLTPSSPTDWCPNCLTLEYHTPPAFGLRTLWQTTFKRGRWSLNTSTALSLSTGSPQGCVLIPLLYTLPCSPALYTLHDITAPPLTSATPLSNSPMTPQ